MLWIHIGMPKTDTTTLQGYLIGNAAFLADHDIRYMARGRDRGMGWARRICQNYMAVAMSRGWAKAPAPEAFIQEYQSHKDKITFFQVRCFSGVILHLFTTAISRDPSTGQIHRIYPAVR